MHNLRIREQVIQSIRILESRRAEAKPVRVEAGLLPGWGVVSHAETLAGACRRSLRGKLSPGPPAGMSRDDAWLLDVVDQPEALGGLGPGSA